MAQRLAGRWINLPRVVQRLGLSAGQDRECDDPAANAPLLIQPTGRSLAQVLDAEAQLRSARALRRRHSVTRPWQAAQAAH